MDEPLVIVDRYGTRTWLHSDERGSVIAGSNAAGAASHINTYDEYGRGGGSNAFRFGFTGQVRLSGDRHYYKARMYDPGLGRFLQPDPIGYGGGMNMYAYVKGDPVNFTDPTGLTDGPNDLGEVVVTGARYKLSNFAAALGGHSGAFFGGFGWWADGAGGGDGIADGKPFTEETAEQQRKNCKTNGNIARGLSMPSVRARAAEAFAADYGTHWEWGFWTAPKGSGAHAFGLGTSREFGWMDPDDAYPWMFSRIWHGTGAPNVMYHTHRSGLGLSVEDVAWARDTKNSIVAIGGRDVYYCYPG